MAEERLPIKEAAEMSQDILDLRADRLNRLKNLLYTINISNSFTRLRKYMLVPFLT